MINYIHIGMMAIFVLVITANIKDFMRCNYGEICDNIRMFMQKIIWSCLEMENKINNKLGEKKCTKN